MLNCFTDGASIAYRKNKGNWHLYHKPIEISPNDTAEFFAVRIGYHNSDTTFFTLPK